MNYRIEAPDGIWTKKIVETHLGGDAFLRVVITQANLKNLLSLSPPKRGVEVHILIATYQCRCVTLK